MRPIPIAAVLGFAAVALGAFGAHGLQDLLQTHGTEAIWQTAVQYHFYHTLAILVVGLFVTERLWCCKLWLAGILVFSGSLYLLAVTDLRWLGAITPIGGLLLLAGWGALVFVKPRRTP